MSDSVDPKGPSDGVVAYVTVRDANGASEFYQKAFGAEELYRNTADDGRRLMHCHLRINGGSLMLSDAFPEFGAVLQEPQAFTLHLQVDDVDAWWRRAVDAGAEVTMELADQFWGDRYGKIRDPYGISWSLAAPSKQ
ncbi:MAG TPA: VOC family protein [Allosphingosinicella sp.]|uniref:VOC family protein n=1 Tax=Allosphingosinicella sp. TaxID=2823234 RepID=UPI002ED8E9AE